MKRCWIPLLLAVALVMAMSAGIYAQGVLKTDMGSGKQIVKVRKYLMQTIKLNLADAGAKAGAKNLEAIVANGASMALSARVMPPLYREKNESAYDGKGKYFKGAAPADFEAASETMRVAAQTLRRSAEKKDTGGVLAALNQLGASCKSCHRSYRGKF